MYALMEHVYTITRKNKIGNVNLMEVGDDGRWNIVDNTTGMLGHISQTNTQIIYKYISHN